MKVKSIRSLLWLGNLLVIVGIALLLVQIVVVRNKIREKYIQPAQIERAGRAKPTVEVSTGAGLQNYNVYANCFGLNITGREPKVEDLVEEGESVVPPLTPIDSVLQVIMVFCGGPEKSCAFIHYVEDGAATLPAAGVTEPPREPGTGRGPARLAQAPIRPGEELRAPYNGEPFLGKVKLISAEGVTFSWGGDDVLVTPKKMERDQSAKPKTLAGLNDTPEEAAARAAAREAQRESKKIHEHSWFIGFDERDRIVEEHEALLNEISLGTTFSKEEKRWLIKLNGVPEESLAAARGFEVGDILHKINGERVSSKSAIVQYFEQHPNVTTMNVEIERRGTRLTKTFQIAQ